MIHRSRWSTADGALSVEAIRARFGGPSIRISEWNCRRADGWKFGGSKGATWICVSGGCKVVFHRDDTDRPPTEESFWASEGVILKQGDVVRFDDSRYVLGVLLDEVEATLCKVVDLSAIVRGAT